MTGDRGAALDELLRRAAGDELIDPTAADQMFADVWSRVRSAASGDHGAQAGERSRRRLDVIANAEAAARRRRRLVRGVSVGVALAVAGGGTAAAATYIATRTGKHTTGWQTSAAGPGEILNMAGSDYGQVIRQITADIPFAPGWEHERELALHDGYLAPEPGSVITTSAVRGHVTNYAVCSWAAYWLAADVAGDDASRAAATRTLSQSLTWPSVTALDQHPSPTGQQTDQGPTRFGWLPPIISAAQAGDRQRLVTAMDDHSVNSACSSPRYTRTITAAQDDGAGR
jgi:hypothetical protein